MLRKDAKPAKAYLRLKSKILCFNFANFASLRDNYSYIYFRLICLIFLSSCSYNNKEKLTGNWKVIFNITYSPKLNDIKDWAKDSLAKSVTKNENDFNGTI